MALCLIGVALVASAGTPRVVVVIRPKTPTPAVTEVLTRIRGELSAAGFRIVVVEHTQGADPAEEVATVAKESHPTAIVAIFSEPDRKTADVWVADRISGRTTVKRVELETRRAPDSPSVLAVRAVELVRAEILALVVEANSPAPSQSAPPPPSATSDSGARPAGSSPPSADKPLPTEAPLAVPPPEAVQPSRPGALEFELGVTALGSLESIDPMTGPIGRIGYRALPRLSLRLTVMPTTFARPMLSAEGGTAFIDQRFALAEGVLSLSRSTDVIPYLSLGLGAYQIDVEGFGSMLSEGRREDMGTGGLDTGFGLRFHIARWLALGTEAHAMLTWRYPVVRINGVEAARTGRPLLYGAVTLFLAP